jgi:hypothetical protein
MNPSNAARQEKTEIPMTQTSDPQGMAVLQPNATQTVQVSATITVKNQNTTKGGAFTITIGEQSPQANTIDPAASTDFATGGPESVTVANTGGTVLQLDWK